jgi:DNA polymerase III delta prime subunit
VTSLSNQLTLLEELVVEQGSLIKDLATLQLELRKTLYSKNTGYAVIIKGDAGTGKTTLVKKFKENAEQHLVDMKETADIVYLETPANPVGKDLYVALLEALGTPCKSMKKIESLTEREQKREIIEIIKNRNIRVLILDEFQHATEKLGDKKMRITSDFLKAIINTFPILLIFAGTEKVRRLLDNEQFESRTSIINKQAININCKKQYVEYANYLLTIQSHLELKDIELNTHNYALPIFYESRGDLRVITDIIQTALMEADTKESSSLRRRHFVDSWKPRFRPQTGAKVPFRGNPWRKYTEQLMNALDINYDIN